MYGHIYIYMECIYIYMYKDICIFVIPIDINGYTDTRVASA